MSDLFIKKYVLSEVNGKLFKSPIYGNFCPTCQTSSDNIHAFNGGLLRCTKCDYLFTAHDILKEIKQLLNKNMS